MDDGSTDGTKILLETYKQDYVLPIRIISYSHNLGKWAALQKAILSTASEYYLFMDADLSTDIHEIATFFSIRTKADIIIWVRDAFRIQRTQWKKLLGIISKRCIRSMLWLPYTDTQCWFKLFHKKTRHLWSSLLDTRWWSDFEVLYKAQRHGYTIYQLPVHRKDSAGSKVKKLDYITTFFSLVRISLLYTIILPLKTFFLSAYQKTNLILEHHWIYEILPIFSRK